MPRQRLAAGADPAPARLRRPVRLGLPGAAAPDEAPLDGPPGPLADFTDLHAWAEAYMPGAGWIGLDPTSGLLAGEGHIPLVCTPQPSTAAPISGAIEPCEVTFEFSNARPPARRAAPCHPALLRRAVGRHRRPRRRGRPALAAGDVRLTLGGEPTFVATDDMEDAEWTTAADGATSGPGPRRSAGACSPRFGARRPYPSRAGQVVPGRTSAPVADRRALAGRRGAALGRPGPPRRPCRLPRELQAGPANGPDALAKGAAALAALSPSPSGCPTGVASRPMKTRCTVSWPRPACLAGSHRRRPRSDGQVAGLERGPPSCARRARRRGPRVTLSAG